MSIDFVGSPNYTKGRQDTTIDRIVIHWADGTIQAADQTFQDVKRQTSAHYGVEDGVIHQYVDESNTAYHSGSWPMNLRSIGIEHSAQPGRDATEDTYRTSAQLIADICGRHDIPIDREHIIKHSEVITTQCPGTVDIDKLIELVKGDSMQASFDDVVECYWTGLHRNFEKGEVTKEEIQGQVGRKIVDILADFRGSPEWLTQNDYVKFGPERAKPDQKIQQAKALASQIQQL